MASSQPACGQDGSRIAYFGASPEEQAADGCKDEANDEE